MQQSVSCAFCGLMCDDLAVAQDSDGLWKVTSTSCARAVRGWQQSNVATSPMPPRIDGKPTSWDDALLAAAGILNGANRPLLAGLACDLLGMRKAIQLASSLGAMVDQANAEAAGRNLLALQQTGWVATTLSEVRNRSDLVLLVGHTIEQRFPRLRERVLEPKARLNGEKPRTVIWLGPESVGFQVSERTNNTQSPKPSSSTVSHQLHPCAPKDLLARIALLRSILFHPERKIRGEVDYSTKQIAEQMLEAEYVVIAWSAGDLELPEGDLIVDALVGIVRDLNRTRRAACLPLAGTNADITALQVCTWQTGFPVRQSLASGLSHFDPHRYATNRLLQRKEVDAAIWISAIHPEIVPPEIPKLPADRPEWVFVGHPSAQLNFEPRVFLPTAIPGIDHDSQFFRSDSVVVVPFQAVRKAVLPSVAEVIAALSARLLPMESQSR